MVSIIIPAYNSQRTICRAIDSCLNQTYKDIEIIVVNDGSTDNTKDILRRYDDEPKVTCVYQENQERSVARNNGLCMAKGELIQFLDADDMIHESKLEKQVRFLQKNEEYFMVYCGVEYKNENNKVMLISKKKHQGYIQKKLLHGNFIAIHSPLIRKNDMRFSQDINMLEDWEYWVLSTKNTLVGYMDEILCTVFITKQMTRKYKFRMLNGHIFLYNKFLKNDDFKKFKTLFFLHKFKIYLLLLKLNIFK